MILTFGQTICVPNLVLACGCFDVLTVGHVRHLQAARVKGLSLCVLVTADKFIDKPGRPIFGEAVRAEVIDALRCVSFTVVNLLPTAVAAIRLLRPMVYVKGGEYKNRPTLQLCAEREAIEEVGGRLEFTDEMEFHTTDVLKELRT